MRGHTAAIVGALLACGGTAAGQGGWQAHPANPVLQPGGSAWDAVAVGQPSCLFDDGVFRMWYSGAAADQRIRVLLAESPDGVTWNRHPTPVLDVGEDGAWDGWSVDTPEIVRSGDSYFLYYFGQRDEGTVEGGAIGVAVSTDGIDFERVGAGPILEPGPAGAWDERWVESPTVVVDPDTGRWRMWYSGMSLGWVAAIGLAVSDDGILWRKHPGNPVFSPTPAGAWDDGWVAVPTVIRFHSALWLFYSGISADDLAGGRLGETAVGFAWSMNGVRWLGRRSAPVFGPADPINSGPWAPTVVFQPEGSELDLWFETSSGIGIAVASSPPPIRRAPTRRLIPDW